MPSAKFATFPRLDFYHGPLCLSPRRQPQPPCNPATVQRVFPPKHRFDARRFVDRLQWDSIGRRFGWICNPALLADFAFLFLRAPRLMDCVLQGERAWVALHRHCHSADHIPEGINGYALPPKTDAAAYAKIIRRAIDSEEHYQRLAKNAEKEFHQRLNRDTSCREFLQLLEERVLQQSERRSPFGSSPALS